MHLTSLNAIRIHKVLLKLGSMIRLSKDKSNLSFLFYNSSLNKMR
jgi:hypothetical protein